MVTAAQPIPFTPPLHSPLYRRVVAAIVLNATQCIGHLTKETNLQGDQFYEGIEALRWLRSSEGETYFEYVETDRDRCFKILGVSTVAARTLELLPLFRKRLFHHYVAHSRYMAAIEKRKVTYASHVAYADWMIHQVEKELPEIVALGLFRTSEPDEILLDPL